MGLIKSIKSYIPRSILNSTFMRIRVLRRVFCLFNLKFLNNAIFVQPRLSFHVSFCITPYGRNIKITVISERRNCGIWEGCKHPFHYNRSTPRSTSPCPFPSCLFILSLASIIMLHIQKRFNRFPRGLAFQPWGLVTSPS